MTQDEFVEEYGDALVAYWKLTQLLGEEEAKQLLDKMLSKYE